MKMKQVSEHIWSIKEWMLIPIHVWVVIDKEGVTLVDAGIPKMAKGILTSIEQLEAGPLKHILLTHGHSDHVGALKKIQSETQVPVFAHKMEIPYMEGDKRYPRRKKFEMNVEKNMVQPLPTDKHEVPIQFSGLQPYLTPGHSPGHVVYYHEADNVLLAGDLFTSKRGKIQQPLALFTGDMQAAVKSSTILEQLQPERLEVCHGDSVFHPAAQLEAYMNKMEQKLKMSIR